MLVKFLPLSFVDWPGHNSVTLFFAGCSYRCPFCHNKELQRFAPEVPGVVEDIEAHIERHSALLDAMVLTGGEPSIFLSDYRELIEYARSFGLSICLHTAGYNAMEIERNHDILDYVIVDGKAETEEEHERITGFPGSWHRLHSTIRVLENYQIPFEIHRLERKEADDEN